MNAFLVRSNRIFGFIMIWMMIWIRYFIARMFDRFN